MFYGYVGDYDHIHSKNIVLTVYQRILVCVCLMANYYD